MGHCVYNCSFVPSTGARSIAAQTLQRICAPSLAPSASALINTVGGNESGRDRENIELPSSESPTAKDPLPAIPLSDVSCSTGDTGQGLIRITVHRAPTRIR